MSISASWIVLAVLLLRLLLKKAPKWITVLLWSIVAVRLICPFSIESAMSLIPSSETINTDIMVEGDSMLENDIVVEHKPLIDTGVPIINDAVNPIIEENFSPELEMEPQGDISMTPMQGIISILSWAWVGGMVVMLAYTVISYLRVKNKIGTAVLLRDNIYQSENVVSPFVLGVVKPRIYLPFNMDEQDMEHVIAHENAHIRRKDHLWKPFGFLLLTLHWFNPFIWLGYVLLCRDIELACDEKVVKEFDNQQKVDYAQALLTCSVNRRVIAACPIAFGEVGVKDRVKSVLNYKKPAFWIIIIAIIASSIAAVCFLTDPVSKEEESEVSEEIDVSKDFVEGSLLYDLGATSIESIESCRLLDDGPVAEVFIGKEDFDIFAKYRFVENFNPKDKIHEVLLWPKNQRISIIINGNWFTLYLPEDGRIVVQVSGSFKVYQADENNRITHEKFEELVRKYTQIGNLEESETTEQTNTSENANPIEKSELLLGVLRNETKFIDEDGKEIYLKDYKLTDSTLDAVYEMHTWVDFDSDGQNELVVYVTPKTGVYLVFHIENGQVFCFEFAGRGMLFLKEDGTYVGSEGAAIQGYYSLNFKNLTYEEMELAYIDDLKKEFRLDGNNATEEEFEVFYVDFCKKKDVTWSVNQYETEATIPDQLYTQFLNGEIAANENGQEKFLKDYLNSYHPNDDGKYKYTFIDMTGDGIEELCIKNYELYFFTIENGALCHWCTEGVTYTDLLNNGALFYERHGGAPTNICYQYYELDEKGSVSFKITFDWYDGSTVEEGKVYPDRYWVNDKEVTKEAYEEKTKEYLELGKDKVTWYDGDVNVTIK